MAKAKPKKAKPAWLNAQLSLETRLFDTLNRHTADRDYKLSIVARDVNAHTQQIHALGDWTNKDDIQVDRLKIAKRVDDLEEAICPRVAARLTALERESARTIQWKDNVLLKVDEIIKRLNETTEVAHRPAKPAKPVLLRLDVERIAARLYARKYGRKESGPGPQLIPYAVQTAPIRNYWYDQAVELLEIVYGE